MPPARRGLEQPFADGTRAGPDDLAAAGEHQRHSGRHQAAEINAVHAPGALGAAIADTIANTVASSDIVLVGKRLIFLKASHLSTARHLALTASRLPRGEMAGTKYLSTPLRSQRSSDSR